MLAERGIRSSRTDVRRHVVGENGDGLFASGDGSAEIAHALTRARKGDPRFDRRRGRRAHGSIATRDIGVERLARLRPLPDLHP